MNFGIDRFSFIVSYLKIRLRRIFRKITIKFFPEHLSDETFLDILKLNNLNELSDRKKPEFFFDYRKKKEIVQSIKKNYPDSIDNTIKDANNICCHVFDFLGSGKTELGKDINWHVDFKSGYEWDSNKFYNDGNGKHLEYTKKNICADVIVPWELSGFMHFPTLGKAYWYTEDDKYINEFKWEVENWISQNPVELGVNWVSSMCNSIRAVNWIWAYYFFDLDDLDGKFKIEFLKNLFLHGRVINKNLGFENRNNHYIADLVGLIYLGIFFHDSVEGKKWFETGFNGLKNEMKRQVYPDGVDFEASIGYHRLVVELFLSATILCINNDKKFPEWYMDKLVKMIEFICSYTKPDGSVPQIGDYAENRLHILSDYSNWDNLNHQYLLSIGSILFGRIYFIRNVEKIHEEAFWLHGGNMFKDINKKRIEIKSKSFPDVGFYIMRQDNLFMIIDSTYPDPNAKRGHRHQSALNFELFAHDKSFIIDPGTYTYTADRHMRNLFRGTAYHNVVEIDGKEQNRFNKNYCFGFEADAKTKVNEWKISKEFDFFDAEHLGYMRLKEPVKHRRQIYFNKIERYWIIKDILDGTGEHRFTLNLHFAPMKMKYYNYKEHSIISDFDTGINIAIIPIELEGLNSEITEGWVSYSYGKKIKAPVLKYSKKTIAPSEFMYLIIPFESKEQLKKVIESLEELDYQNIFQ